LAVRPVDESDRQALPDFPDLLAGNAHPADFRKDSFPIVGQFRQKLSRFQTAVLLAPSVQQEQGSRRQAS
jgi:hypothetical protein